MRLCYWKSPSGNFGDDLNAWYWDRFLDGWRDWDRDRTLIGVGSILNTRVIPESGRYLVLGSGSGFGDLPDVSDNSRWDVRFVRGPKTARNLGLQADAYATDPAALISRLPEFASTVRRGTAFVPHCHSDASRFYDWPTICDAADLTYISPRGDSQVVIRAISRAERVITESMHGAILADAFRVPWLPVAQLNRFNHFKWQDWAASLELELAIASLPAVRTMRRRHAFFSSRSFRDALRRRNPKMVPCEPGIDEVVKVRDDLTRTLGRLSRKAFYLSRAPVLALRLDRIETIFAETKASYTRSCWC